VDTIERLYAHLIKRPVANAPSAGAGDAWPKATGGSRPARAALGTKVAAKRSRREC